MKYLSGWSSLLGTPKLLIGNFLSWANGFGFTVTVIFIHMPKGLLVCVYKSNKYFMITKFKITPKKCRLLFKRTVSIKKESSTYLQSYKRFDY